MASFVNYFQERKNGDAASDGDRAFVPPMVGEAEVIFTTAEAVAVNERLLALVSNFDADAQRSTAVPG